MSIEIQQVESVVMLSNAEIDTQVATAKKYPRNEAVVTSKVVFNITSNRDFAETCRYSKPVGGKQVNGISVHLARVLARQWGNIRCDSRLVRIEEKRVICEAIAYDLETNYAVKRECVRSIFSEKKNTRFSEDVINTTIEAAKAIAFRNAVLDLIPEYVKAACENAAIETITGDLSDESKIAKARNEWVKYFTDNYGITEAQTLSLVGCNSILQLNRGKIADLKGVANAINTGEFNIVNHFNPKPENKQTNEDLKPTL